MKLEERARRHAEPVIRPREDGTLDEVVVSHPAVVHLEQMDEGTWWLGIDLVDGRRVTVNLSTKRNARVYGMAEIESCGIGRLDTRAVEASLAHRARNTCSCGARASSFHACPDHRCVGQTGCKSPECNLA